MAARNVTTVSLLTSSSTAPTAEVFSAELDLEESLINDICEDDTEELLAEEPDVEPWPWFLHTRQEHNRVEGYDDLLHEKDELEFFQHTRVTKRTHAFILNLVKQHYTPVYRGGNVPVDARLALDVALIYLGNKATYREIGELFGLSQGGAHKCVKKIVNILIAEADNFIKWPSAQEVPILESEFKAKAGFMGVIGALDGTHIPIRAPSEMQGDYLNRKMRHCINLMAICDSQKKFIFIDVGVPGCAHDNRVFTSTDLYTGIVQNPQDFFPSPSYHILADSAFQLSEHILTPFRDTGRLTRYEKRYNKLHSKTRTIIEHSFALLKVRFRRLHHVDAETGFISDIVAACCVLQNITLDFPEEEIFLLNEGPILIEENVQPIAERGPPQDARAAEKRNLIALIL